jgi:undecaprenyl-diphosphatase
MRTPGSLAVRLALWLLALLGLVLLAGWVLTRADEGDAFERRDRTLVAWLSEHRTTTLDALSGPVAELGNTGVVVGVAVLAAVVAGLTLRRWWPVVILAAALVGEVLIFLATTALIDRPRPPVEHLDAELPPTSSFPSGHTAAAICLYGVLAALVVHRARSRWRWTAVGAAVVLVVLVALARLYRGAHYPTDVLGSLIFALPWLLITCRLLVPRRHQG